MRLINGLYNAPDPIFEKGILSEISIEEAHPHLFFLFTQPEVDEIMDLVTIHELHVVNMPILLGLYCHVLRLAG